MATTDTATNGRDAANDLTGFQMQILCAVPVAAAESDRGYADPCGLDIKEYLQDEYGYGEIRTGRLYPNLATLAEEGMLNKDAIDDRTHAYRLTDRGLAAVSVLAVRATQAANRAGDGNG